MISVNRITAVLTKQQVEGMLASSIFAERKENICHLTLALLSSRVTCVYTTSLSGLHVFTTSSSLDGKNGFTVEYRGRRGVGVAVVNQVIPNLVGVGVKEIGIAFGGWNPQETHLADPIHFGEQYVHLLTTPWRYRQGGEALLIKSVNQFVGIFPSMTTSEKESLFAHLCWRLAN